MSRDSPCRRPCSFLEKLRIGLTSFESERARLEVFLDGLASNPTPLKLLCYRSRRQRTTKRVNHNVVWIGQHFHEEPRQRRWESSGMNFDSLSFAAHRVCVVSRV